MRGSNSIQQVNKRKKRNASSEYFGVTWSHQKQKWLAKITVNYETKSLGLYDNEREAAIAYLKGAIKQWGSGVRIEDQKRLGLISQD